MWFWLYSLYSHWANYNPANNRITTASSAMGGYVYYGIPVDRSSSTGWDASGNTLFDGYNEYWYDAEGARIAKDTLSAPSASSAPTLPAAPPARRPSARGLH